jgi:hypothetical protein
MSDGEWIPARPHCLPGCERLDGHDGRDPGACMKDGAELAPEQVTIPRWHLDHLLAAATVYIEAFDPEEMLTLPGKMALQEVEAIVEIYGKRY